jgi:hypothetical protein
LKKIFITKANGGKAVFDVTKVESTCIRAGASSEQAKRIAYQTYSRIYQNISTKEIYRMVLGFLAKENIAAKHRYRLKESIMKLGPAGFSFEIYVGQILQEFGYKVSSIGSEVQGRCVRHEIDLFVEYQGKRWLVECKYHNVLGRYTGLKESLYTHARFLDLEGKVDAEMLVCNTKVSPDVITYALCVGQKVLSWKYPIHQGLEKMIEEKKLYPITIIMPTKRELELFLKNNLMIAKNILDIDVQDFAAKTKIPVKRIVFLQRLVNQIIS